MFHLRATHFFSEHIFNRQLLFKIEDREPKFLSVLLYDVFHQIMYFSVILNPDFSWSLLPPPPIV